jgi:lincosamide nucleotidyltransferase A/C/D/E
MAAVMTAADVLDVLDLLEAAGVVAWVDGGWGVDALLGEQTRDHNDLDLAINHFDVECYRATMRASGFHPTETLHATPKNFVMADRNGREVDVHLVDRGVVVPVAGGIDVYGPNGLEYEVGSLDGTGTIGDRSVRCCTPDFMVRSHTTYEPDLDDARDVFALTDRFAIPLPEMYERFRDAVSRGAGPRRP